MSFCIYKCETLIQNKDRLNRPRLLSRRRPSYATFCFYKIEYLKNERSPIVIGVGPPKMSFISEYFFFKGNTVIKHGCILNYPGVANRRRASYVNSSFINSRNSIENECIAYNRREFGTRRRAMYAFLCFFKTGIKNEGILNCPEDSLSKKSFVRVLLHL